MNAPVPPAIDRLARKRSPGPKSKATTAAFDLGAETLADAHAILDAVESGRLTRQYPGDGPVAKRGRLNAEDELRFVVLARAGNIDARNRLITANLGLVHMMARPFRKFGEEQYHDLVAEGIFGIARAVETFDPARGFKFSTYAVHWIRAKIQRARQKMLREEEPVMPIALHGRGENGDHFVTLDDGKKMRRRSHAISLESPVTSEFSDDGGVGTFGDGLASEVESPEAAVIRSDIEAEVRRHVDGVVAETYGREPTSIVGSTKVEQMGDRARKIVFERLLVDGEPKTLAGLGVEMGLSREAVRLYESRLTRALRRRLDHLRAG